MLSPELLTEALDTAKLECWEREVAIQLKEAQLFAWFGWVQGSDVPARYVHLSGHDIDNAYDEMHGLYVPEEDGDEPQVRECGRCQELNEPEAAFCMRCGYALKGESATDFEADVEKRPIGVCT